MPKGKFSEVMPASGTFINKYNGDIQSTGWKDITLSLYGTSETVTIPVMISTRAAEVRAFLAEITGANLQNIELLFKNGPSLKRHKLGDEIQSKLIVKGLRSFTKITQEYPHPWIVIGLGAMGCRFAMHYLRKDIDFMAFERCNDLGGNAWHLIGNHSSKLQTEGVHYQLQYDFKYGGMESLCPTEEIGYWPLRGEIISHFNRVFDSCCMWPHCRLNTELTEMTIQSDPYFAKTSYDMTWVSTEANNSSKGIFKCSCITFLPGCLVTPHRRVWPGEESFGGQIGYGFGREFDFSKVDGQDAIIIGQGAFSHENVRSFCENNGNKVYIIARHWNLMLPRMMSWWINQAIMPIQAAMILHGMTPVYSLMGWDQWSWYSVTTNADRKIASIKQYTRWGISDILFLCCYFGKAEIFEAEVKRFKYRTVVLNNGKVLENIDHVMKVIGFDGDWAVDRLMRTKQNVGIWPDADWRRVIFSDNSAIDASRFNAMSVAPGMGTITRQVEFFWRNPAVAHACATSGMLPINHADVEHGSPCYHFEPRVHVSIFFVMGSFSGDLNGFAPGNDSFKKATMNHFLDIPRYLLACKEDWNHYCAMFKEQGWTKPWPEYPYTVEFIRECVRMEEEDVAAEMAKRFEKKVESDVSGLVLEPGESVSMEPARAVLRAVARFEGDKATIDERSKWHAEGQGTKQWLLDNVRPRK